MQQLLLVEDQLDFQLTVKQVLGSVYNIQIASSLAEGRAALSKRKFDLILLDVTLTDGTGFEFMHQLKASPETRAVPVIFLTAKSEIQDRVTGLDLGAEDYILKPFEPQEFKARVASKLRMKPGSSLEIIRQGRLELDCKMHKCFVRVSPEKKQELDLTPHEFRLLVHFVGHQNQTLSREELMKIVWGDDVHVLKRTVDRHVSALRRKLDPSFERLDPIHSVGYRFSMAK